MERGRMELSGVQQMSAAEWETGLCIEEIEQLRDGWQWGLRDG